MSGFREIKRPICWFSYGKCQSSLDDFGGEFWYKGVALCIWEFPIEKSDIESWSWQFSPSVWIMFFSIENTIRLHSANLLYTKQIGFVCFHTKIELQVSEIISWVPDIFVTSPSHLSRCFHMYDANIASLYVVHPIKHSHIVYPMNHAHILRTWRQKQVSQAGISNWTHRLLWDAITYPCLRYLLLVPKSSFLTDLLLLGFYHHS